MFRGTWRDEKHGQSVGTVSVDDVDWTKLVITSEDEKSSSTVRKGQLRDTCSVGSDNFETEFKDHELEDGTQALVLFESWEASCVSAIGRRFFDLCQGRCARSSGEDVMTPQKEPLQNKHMTNSNSERNSAVRTRSRWSRLRSHQDTFVAECCHGSHQCVQQDQQW